jgi:hypothetical protein
MIRFAFLILIMFSIIMGSCSGRKNKLDNKNLIPEKELVSLLTDIHIADGLLSLPKINSWYSSLDSIASYYQVIEKHGYTKEMMDRTMKYYFFKNPKRLNKIYDQVLGILSKMESRIEKESIIEQARISNLWRGKGFYSIPSISGNDSTMFDISLYRPGYYTLSFSATLFPDDQSINPRPIAYSTSADSIETGKRQYIKSIKYIKDGRPHTYNLFITVSGNIIRRLRGILYDFDNRPYGIEKHINIENLSLTYSTYSSLAV